MKCPNCGTENEEGALFCSGCGAKLGGASYNNQSYNNAGNMNNGANMSNGGLRFPGGQSYGAPQMPYQNPNANMGRDMAQSLSVKDIKDVLVDPSEKVISTFGNNYLQQIVFNSDCTKFAYVLSDKRLYFKGMDLAFGDKKTVATAITEKIVDLQDISFTAFKHMAYFPAATCFIGILLMFVPLFIAATIDEGFMWTIFWFCFFSGAIMVAVSIISYILSRGTYFVVSTSGGTIACNIKLYGLQSAVDFQKQIRRTKDKVLSK